MRNRDNDIQAMTNKLPRLQVLVEAIHDAYEKQGMPKPSKTAVVTKALENLATSLGVDHAKAKE